MNQKSTRKVTRVTSPSSRKSMKTLSTAEVYELVQAGDDLGYMITDRISADEIIDPVLSTLWEDAGDLLRSIEDYLESNADNYDGIDTEEEDNEDYD